jgi:ankyrin repeat protein
MTLYRCILNEEWDLAQRLLDDDDPSSNSAVRLELTRRDNNGGAYLLHFACTSETIPAALIGAMLDRINNPAIERAVDKGGNSVLHYASALGSLEVLQLLLERNPMASTANSPFTPLNVAWHSYVHRKLHDPEGSEAVNERIRHLVDARSVRSLCKNKSLQDLWNKTILLCNTHLQTVTTPPESISPTWNVTAMLVRFGGEAALRCPVQAVWLSMAVYRDYNLLATDSSRGNTLLHWAAESAPLSQLALPPRIADFAKRVADECWNLCAHRSVIAQLCHKEPMAARHRNADRQLPLHLAIETGKPWRDGLDVLLRAHPGSVHEPDPATGLPPALQAACDRSACDLSTVYEMIRSRPHLVVVEPARTKTRDAAKEKGR